VVIIYKSFIFVDLRTLKCLNKYLFRKRRCNDILQNYILKIYIKNIENEEIVNLELKGFIGYL
jgi:hypothetical protein